MKASLYITAKERGMTLLEVMLALVILATAGLAVMKAASESLNNQAYLQDKTFALWVASNHLVELKLQKIALHAVLPKGTIKAI